MKFISYLSDSITKGFQQGQTWTAMVRGSPMAKKLKIRSFNDDKFSFQNDFIFRFHLIKVLKMINFKKYNLEKFFFEAKRSNRKLEMCW